MNIRTSLPPTAPRKDKRYLQPYQIEYIRENGAALTVKQLSTAIGCSQPTIFWHCKKMNIRPTKSYFQFKKPEIPLCVDPKKITNE